eukprot:3516228-Pyramimonas_sp.AAC.1
MRRRVRVRTSSSSSSRVSKPPSSAFAISCAASQPVSQSASQQRRAGYELHIVHTGITSHASRGVRGTTGTLSVARGDFID